ncbi:MULTISPECIES: helicase-related protein [unclassified Sphingomonas]|uniref:helicase-related protein n=1 Tax=unclassified Sphingomonas TaxID=196159 RepID=UPI00226AFD50
MSAPPQSVRTLLLLRLKADLVGPKDGPEETIDERPSARYLTGILYPQQSEFSEEEDDSLDAENGGGSTGDEDEQREATSLFRSFKPATCGFSFSVETEEEADLRLTVRFGRYAAAEIQIEGGGRPHLTWTRTPHEHADLAVPLEAGVEETRLEQGLTLHRRVRREGARATVTLQFINEYREAKTGRAGDPLVVTDMMGREAAGLHQFEASVECRSGCTFVPRRRSFRGNDEDERIADLIYREAAEYAVGHTASAQWEPVDHPTVVRLGWFPTAMVKRMDADGDPLLSSAIAASPLGRLHGLTLYAADKPNLVATLASVADGYAAWIAAERDRSADLPDSLALQARRNLDRCERALARMHEGIGLIDADPQVETAFRLANRAMYLQAAWAGERRAAADDVDGSDAFDFQWRPFQIAFALLCLPSSADRGHPDREIFDLIWFPTGGGKTEAYLLLTAFVLFHRRMLHGDEGAGVGVLMRYTLRTLTVQQFQRAAALITACEQLRLDGDRPLGSTPFSIGLWVGSDSTPNSYDAAVEALADLDPKSTPKQLTRCPVCRGEVHWRADAKTRTITCECPDPRCNEERPLGRLTVLTVDEDLYAAPPSLLIGTVDKFAQIVRKQESGALFGLRRRLRPPDLIIQDELHLIGGPLGSLTGLYETAIDELCRSEGGRAKVVGSTATIRRADEQIRHVFNRSVFQFPPPAIDWSNSCFARVDEADEGRLYVGVTTAGRSEKFALQAASASLLQAGADPAIHAAGDIDPYWTLVAYFNSLKVLGGALVLMEDDVRITVAALAQQHGEFARRLGTPEELTSRKASSEIPMILDALSRRRGDAECIDVLLASNMLSVGVDIPRLGLMLVNGQPKFMAEYIQATSRVGRRSPGLVVTLYNNNKIRDRAHYETFASWHGALYRSVEPSSVTPFAPRARDKAIHAPLVALVRHLISPGTPNLRRTDRAAVLDMVDRIVERVRTIDPGEAVQCRAELGEFVEAWLDGVEGGRIKAYWNDRRFNSSLLMSAEAAAARRAVGAGQAEARPTPNSVRNVEPSVDFVLKERP